MKEIVLTDAPDQEFEIFYQSKRLKFRFRFLDMLSAWVFDMQVNNVSVIHGRRVNLQTDLIAPFNLGIGRMIAVDYADTNAQADRTSIPNREVRIFLATEDEIAAATAV